MRNFFTPFEGEEKLLDEKELEETKKSIVRNILSNNGYLRASEMYYNRGNYKFWATYELQQEGTIRSDGNYWYLCNTVKAMLLYG